ncbi:MAG: neprosin family prolyl endopeptidase [Chitinophagaceae bacterium]|nr:neprosin family prolyl endopeptidase [Chitinophagaceae bacterium]
MKKNLLLVLSCVVVITLLLTKCKTPNANNRGPIKFSEFVDKLDKSAYRDFQGKSGVQVQDENAFNEMKKYLLVRYKGVQVKQSFVGTDGQIVDCIPINEQPYFRLKGVNDLQITRQAPSFTAQGRLMPDSSGRRLSDNYKSIDITLKEGAKDKYGNAMYCPDGYIPVKRVTLDVLIHYKTLDQFFGKTGILMRRGNEPVLYGDGLDHNHVVGIQNVDNAGGDSWLNVWNPNVSPGSMSLSQQWFTGGSGDGLQTIEGGWQVLPSKYNTNNACLFIYSTNANYTKGSGGYNLDNGAFVQTSNQIYLGAPFDHYSATNGGQWGFNLQWKRNTDGNWWLFYKGPGNYIAVGYYPKSFYGNGQMSNFADRSDFGGEVAGSPSEGQMGSGAAGADGWQKAAYQNRIFYILKDNIEQSAWSDLSKFEENASCYTGDLHNIYGDWGTYLYFGGSRCN